MTLRSVGSGSVVDTSVCGLKMSTVMDDQCAQMKTIGGPLCDKHLVENPSCTFSWWFWAVQPALLLLVCPLIPGRC